MVFLHGWVQAIGLDFYTANMLSDALAAPALSFIPTSEQQVLHLAQKLRSSTIQQ